MTEPAVITPRRFLPERHVDVTGVSGVGPVAEGLEWSDGTVSLRWKGATPCLGTPKPRQAFAWT